MTGLRFALRQLLRVPAVSVTIVISLALAIGSSAVIFAVIENVLLSPLPYAEPSRIVRVFETTAGGVRLRPSDPNFDDLRAASRSFAALARYNSLVESVTSGGEAVRATAAFVSHEFFEVLGVTPILGRTFLPEESRLGGPPAALVSHRYWQRNLGGTRDLASQTLRVHERDHSIVGVLPPSFDFPNDADVWTPSELWPAVTSRTGHSYEAIGRLASASTLASAQGELSAIARRLAAQHGDDTDMADAAVLSLREVLVGDAQPALLVLASAVALLFVAAGVNVASLLFARAVVRERELAVRVALGASRLRLARLFLAETIVPCATGALLGALLAWLAVESLTLLHAGRLPRAETVAFDAGTVAFVVVLTLSTATILAGLLAWRASPVGVGPLSRPRATAGRSRTKLHGLLVSAQVAIALVLMIGAALLGRSFVTLATVDLGFRTDDVLFMNLGYPEGDRSDRASLVAFYDSLVRELVALPGVVSVGGVTVPPLADEGWNGTFVLQDRIDQVSTFDEFSRLAADPARSGLAELRIATEDYFEVLDIPILRGRSFEPADGPSARHVALVSRTLAERTWPGEDPLGKLVQFGNMDGDLTPFTVVGVVGDLRHRGLDIGPPPTIYAYHRQRPRSIASFWIAMRTDDAELVVPRARAIVRDLSPGLAPAFRTGEELFSGTLAERRFNLALLGVFGVAALLLSLAGVYGSMAFNVAQRTRETGIRLALGAARRRVVALAFTKGMAWAGLGIVLGLAAALASTRLLTSMLYGIPAHDPVAYGSVTLAIALAASIAAWAPARRAARIDPMVALRHD